MKKHPHTHFPSSVFTQLDKVGHGTSPNAAASSATAKKANHAPQITTPTWKRLTLDKPPVMMYTYLSQYWQPNPNGGRDDGSRDHGTRPCLRGSVAQPSTANRLCADEPRASE